MKPKGRHRERALSPLGIKAAREPGRYSDGSGLYLVVDKSGAKRWVLRTVAMGRRRDIGLGSAKVVTLAEARERAVHYRKMAKDGGDPVAQKRRERKIIPTFEVAARTVHAEHKASWKNAKHAAQWINTLEQYVFKTMGSHRVDEIDTPEILKALSPVWLTKPVTARRVRQRIGTVLDWAKASGFRSGDNPVSGVIKGLPKQLEAQEHHSALPYAEVPAFVASLRHSGIGAATKLALELLILTALRTSEVLGATWSEIDFEQKVWCIPATRMKAKREHRVPLSPRSVEILRELKRFAGASPFVCPGRTPGRTLSNMVFLMALRRLKLSITVHGFRSAFRDWAAERTNYSREVCEQALAHTLKDKTEAAYRRSDLFDKRATLMNAWADFAGQADTNSIPIRASGPTYDHGK